MSDSHLLHDMLHAIGLVKSDEQKEQADKSGVAGDARTLVDFSQRLNEVLKQHPDVGGHLFMLDFSQVKSAIKSNWQSDSEKIHKRIRRIITSHLAPYDLTIQKDGTTHLMLFPSLNSDEGQIKSAMIAEELGEALLGAKGAKNVVGVRAVTVSSGGGFSTREVLPVSKVLERVTSRLGHVPKPRQQTEAVARRAPTKRLPEDQPLTASRTPLEYGVDYHFVFRPLLSVNTKVISTFLCIPVRETAPGHFKSGYDILPKDRTINDIFELDMTMAARIASEVRILEQSKKRSLLALPVHFEVLADRARRLAYLEFCKNEFKGVTKRIVIEITNLPEGIPHPRLMEFVTALKTVSRAVIARFSAGHHDFEECRGLGLHAVGMEVYNASNDEAELMRQMNVFSQSAHQVQLKTYLEGVRTLSLFTAAMTSGYDYIAGYAVSDVVESADEIKSFQLDSIYLSRLHDAGQVPKE